MQIKLRGNAVASQTTKLTLANTRDVGKGVVLWDADVRGFGFRGNSAEGRGTFFVKKRVNGRQRWVTIGKLGSPWTPETARKEALRIVQASYEGLDVVAEKREREARGTTLSSLLDKFLEDYGPRLKGSTRDSYGRSARVRLKPSLGHLTLDQVSTIEIRRAHGSWASEPRAANYALAILSKALSWAQENGYGGEGLNPCKGIKKFKERKRERFLSEAEAKRLGEVLEVAAKDGSENPYVIAVIWLTIFTGARKSEISTLRWSYVDLASQLLRLPDSKTGPKVIPLNSFAIEILSTLKRIKGNPFVFPGHGHGKHLVNYWKVWDRLRMKAGLEDVRIHDLRHSFGSTAMDTGGSTRVLGRVMGHGNTTTTDRYAHVKNAPALKLSEETGALIAKRMKSAVLPAGLGQRVRLRRRVFPMRESSGDA
jgi:integrase